MEIDDVLREMDLEFLALGEYGIPVHEAAGFVAHPHFVFLDLRTDEEIRHLAFPFAKHIPLCQLPDRLNEVPRDRFIITFCVSGFRAAMGYVYLRVNGYDEVKALKGPLTELAGCMSPGRLYRLAGKEKSRSQVQAAALRI